MATASFKFYELSEDVCEQLQLHPLPFPVRSRRAKSVFEKKPLKLDKILEELDAYRKSNPEEAGLYSHNTATLAMISATNHMHANDASAALVSLGIGLRAAPGNNSLKLHQALALQTLEYHELAAYEYDQLLHTAPIAYDPVVRSLAAKAFASAGQKDKALAVLEALPETAFNDEGLANLREYLSDGARGAAWDASVVTPPEDANAEDLTAPTEPAPEPKAKTKKKIKAPKFCRSCGTARTGRAKFCTSCGAKNS